MIHEKAIVDDGVDIGGGTRVWAFAHVQEGAKVGEGCNVGEAVFIEKGAIVGNNVTIKNGVQVWDGVILEDNVFVGPNATFSNDKFPRSKQAIKSLPPTRVCQGASIGANATILPGVTVGVCAMVGAASVVTHDVSPKTVVVGNPARHMRHADVREQDNSQGSLLADKIVLPPRHNSSFPVRLTTFPSFVDRRGKLSFTEFDTGLPWMPKRFFVVYDTPDGELRGYHAHRTLHECLICVHGCVKVMVDNGTKRNEVMLDSPFKCLLVPPMTWLSQHYVKPGSVLIVLASEKHTPEKYIHDYGQFLELTASSPSTISGPNGEEEDNEKCLQSNIKVKFLDIKAINKPLESQFKAAFSRVLDSGCFILGPEVEAFEKEWAAFCGAKYCVGVGSGLAALLLLLMAAGIEPHHEVIVPSNTYIATVLAITHAGAKPVFVEPNPLTHTIDATGISSAVTENTHSIMTVDLYGQTSDMDPIIAIAKEHDLYVFADSAQGHGARYKGRIVGSHCDASCFSFYPGKNLGALGDAGAVVTSNPVLADRVKMLRNYGSRLKYYNDMKGVNERMDPLQAAMLRCKVPHLVGLNESRSSIASRYMAGLDGVKWLTLPLVPDWSSPCWHLFVINAHGHRDALGEHLKRCNVDTIIHYPVPPHMQKCFQDLNLPKGSLPIAEKLADGILSLPICPTLTDEQVDHVIKSVCCFDAK